MPSRIVLSALALLVVCAGCTWPGRPDGGKPRHTTATTPDPLTRTAEVPEPVEPLSDSPAGTIIATTSATSGSTGAAATPAAGTAAGAAPSGAAGGSLAAGAAAPAGATP